MIWVRSEPSPAVVCMSHLDDIGHRRLNCLEWLCADVAPNVLSLYMAAHGLCCGAAVGGLGNVVVCLEAAFDAALANVHSHVV